MLNYLAGLFLGISLAAPPGPMNGLIAAESLASAKRGSLTGAGAMTADATLMIVSLEEYELLRRITNYFYPVGAAVMLVMAISVAREGPTASVKGRTPTTFLYAKGYFMGITNPFQIGWWMTAGTTFIGIFGPASALGLFSAISAWILVFPQVINRSGKYGGSTAYSVIKWASVLTMLAFSAYFLYVGFASFTR